MLEHGWLAALIVTAAIIVLFQAEAHLLQPFIMSRSVHVHPLAVVLAVTAGTILGGIAGALVAVPLIAFLNTTVQALRTRPDQPNQEPAFAASRDPSSLTRPPGKSPPTRPDKAEQTDRISRTAAIERYPRTATGRWRSGHVFPSGAPARSP